jgi:hypothetical protein
MTILVSQGSLLLVEMGTNESTGTTMELNQHELNNSYHGLQVEEGALEEKHGTFLTAVTTASASTTDRTTQVRERFVSVYGKDRGCPCSFTVCSRFKDYYKGVYPFYLFSHLLKHSKPTARRRSHASRSDFAESVNVLCVTSRYVKESSIFSVCGDIPSILCVPVPVRRKYAIGFLSRFEIEVVDSQVQQTLVGAC